MATATRRGILAVVVALALLIVGGGVGLAVSDALGVSPVPGAPAPPRSPERDLVMAWMARVLLVLAVAWLVIGMLAARTRLVRRPGAAAARAAWLGATRPWRARESTLGMLRLDRWLLLLVPGALLVATRAVQTSFAAPLDLVLTFLGWTAFAVVVRVLLGTRSPWPVLAAVAGVIVLRCALTLTAVSFAGPGGYAEVFWTDPLRRAGYIGVAVALYIWMLVAAGWAMTAGMGHRRAAGVVLAAAGAGLAVPAAVVGAAGLERALTMWNDQLGLVPWGLSRFLKVADRLEVPASAPWFVFALALAVTAVGVALAVVPRRRRRVPADRPA